MEKKSKLTEVAEVSDIVLSSSVALYVTLWVVLGFFGWISTYSMSAFPEQVDWAGEWVEKYPSATVKFEELCADGKFSVDDYRELRLFVALERGRLQNESNKNGHSRDEERNVIPSR